jgi:DNA repair exonuclease SbcCD nuclease subunit
MMNYQKPFTFLHTADWHIGNPFSRFDKRKRKDLRNAIFRTLEMTFSFAQKKRIPLILCAGDNVDNGQLCEIDDLNRLFSIIKKYPDIRVIMIAGNHDPLVNRSVYSKLEDVNYPDNLHFVKSDEELSYPEWNLKIFASSLREKNGNYNPLDWIKGKGLDKEVINVGLCHGSIKNDAFSDNNFPIESDFALKQGLDYLALGDWHSYKKINDHTYYPGVPEPLQFNDSGFVLEVTIDGPGKIPKVKPFPIDSKYKWIQLEENITDDTFKDFKAKLEDYNDNEIRKLTVNGFLPIETYKAYKEILEMNRKRYFDIRDNVVVQPGDRVLLESVDGYMADVVRRLLELKKLGEPLPEEILNPYAPIDRTEVHRLADELSENREEIIDKALLKIYSYFKEKEQ